MSGHVAVIGLGYIGLPTAVALAGAGVRVTGVDTDAARIAHINAGRSPLDEPGLAVALARNVLVGRLRAAPAPCPADAYLIAVPTPAHGTPPRADLSHVEAAADAIAPHLARGCLVVLESTVPPGTTAALARRLGRARPDLAIPGDVRIAYCPERVLPGRIMAELVRNDRVIGGMDPESAMAAATLYRRFVRGWCHLTDAATAEMVKLAENAYRDVNIAFANELSLIAGTQGVDARAVIRLANRHPRVDILKPGPGVGGHCIAVDPWFLAGSAPDQAHLIPTARAVNDGMPARVAARAQEMVADIDAPAIACFGLTFKPDVADVRESPAVEVARLLAASARGPVMAVDPHVPELPAGLAGVELTDIDEALARADLAILLTDHAEFLGLAPERLATVRVLDTRGGWTGGQAQRAIQPRLLSGDCRVTPDTANIAKILPIAPPETSSRAMVENG